MHAKPKSLSVAYALWFFLGCLGAHHFYLHRWRNGLVYVSLVALACAGLFVFLAVIPIAVIAACLLIDAVRLPGLVRHANALAPTTER